MVSQERMLTYVVFDLSSCVCVKIENDDVLDALHCRLFGYLEALSFQL